MEHKWKKDADSAESCEREGCTVRRCGKKWQRRPRGRWELNCVNTPIPPCSGKEAGEPPSAPCRVCGEVNQHKMSCRPANRRDAALAETDPSPLEVVRRQVEQWLEVGHDNLPNLKTRATSLLATLEESIRKDERSKAATVVDGYARRETKVSVRAPLLSAAADIRGTK